MKICTDKLTPEIFVCKWPLHISCLVMLLCGSYAVIIGTEICFAKVPDNIFINTGYSICL